MERKTDYRLFSKRIRPETHLESNSWSEVSDSNT